MPGLFLNKKREREKYNAQEFPNNTREDFACNT